MQQKNSALWLCDLAFMCTAAIYALLAMEGISLISANGAEIDSDLATYAQALAHAVHPGLFAADPVLSASSPAVDIKNLQSFIARLAMGDGNASLAMLRSGAVCIFMFYCGWYMFGRWLFTRPSLAAMLAVMCGITVWIEYGTFWGINHSDPLPRVYFAAVFPILLLIALAAARSPGWRPLVMLLAGLAMWVHGVSALNAGAMFMALFAVTRPKSVPFVRHLANTFISLCAFIVPVAIFLWPSFSGGKTLDADELAIFQQLFAIRWQSDYSGSPQRLLHLATTANAWSVLALAGFCAWFVALYGGSANEKLFARACPLFIMAIFAVVLFSFAESAFSPAFGRLAAGHELVRGIRFLVPLSIIMIGIALHVLVPRVLIFPMSCVSIALALVFMADRQYAAAQYALAGRLGISSLPLVEMAEKERAKAEKKRLLIDEIRNLVPQGESIFSEDEDMAIRHTALRPLAHAFKDGYIYYYNRDIAGARKWLAMENTLRSSPDGLIEAWLHSGAPWLLCRSGTDRGLFAPYGSIERDLGGWLLVKRK